MKIYALLISAAVCFSVRAQNPPAPDTSTMPAPENVEIRAAGLNAEIDTPPPANAVPPSGSAAFKAPPYLPDYSFWPVSTPGEKPWYTNLWKSDPFAPGHRPAWAPAAGVTPPASINDWPQYDNPEWYQRLIRRFQARHPEPEK